MPREDFVTWAEHDATYKELFDNWVVSGYKRPLVPTVDRVDDKSLAEGGLGYVLGNIQWLTYSENTLKGVGFGKARRDVLEAPVWSSLPSNWKERMMFNRDEWFLWFPSKSHLAARFEYDLAKQILTNNQYRVYFLREILQLRETEIAASLKCSQAYVSATLKRISDKLANPAGLKRGRKPNRTLPMAQGSTFEGQIVLAHGKAKTNALNDKEESLEDPLTLSKWTN